MMPGEDRQTRRADKQPALRLLRRAFEAHRGDAYCAKRKAPRYDLDTPLEARRFQARLHGDAPEEAWDVRLENMSNSGIGFWSRRELEVGHLVEVREWSPEGAGAWFSGRIVHVVRGLRGFLIGARLDESLDFAPPDADDADAQDEDTEPPPPQQQQQRQLPPKKGHISGISAASLLGMAAAVVWMFLRAEA